MRPAILLCGMKSQLQVLPLTKERLTGSPPILEYAPSMKKREIKHCQVRTPGQNDTLTVGNPTP